MKLSSCGGGRQGLRGELGHRGSPLLLERCYRAPHGNFTAEREREREREIEKNREEGESECEKHVVA